jgi:putative ABC transport system ATP-binding protein
LDEPTGDLDTRNTDIVMKILLDLNQKEQITCVMVTHDVALKNYSSKVVRMFDGKVHSVQQVPEEIRAVPIKQLTDRVEAIERGEDVGELNVR